TGGTVSVGMPFYAATFVPLALPLLIIMAIGPFMGWKRGDLRGALQRLIAAAVAAFGAAVIALWIKIDGPILAPLGLLAGVWLLVGTAIEFMERIHLFEGNAARIFTRARHMPRAAYGMSLAHFGLAIAVIGMTGAAAWKTENIKVLR